ncbi:MAG: hypothetical protein V2I26_06180, partial [Halieaceae bacterium]|nr:hypothetical protein [Halieaceae bacterium]
ATRIELLGRVSLHLETRRFATAKRIAVIRAAALNCNKVRIADPGVAMTEPAANGTKLPASLNADRVHFREKQTF